MNQLTEQLDCLEYLANVGMDLQYQRRHMSVIQLNAYAFSQGIESEFEISHCLHALRYHEQIAATIRLHPEQEVYRSIIESSYH